MRVIVLGVILSAAAPLSGLAQFLSVSGGGLFPRDLSQSASAGTPGGPDALRAEKSAILAVDGGVGFLPFVSVGLHYSYTRPEVTLHRSDAFGSSARIDLTSHTLALEFRLRPPAVLGFRPYGLAGAGASRFTLDVKSQVAVPFPNGIPETIFAPAVTFGAGLEKSFFPFLRWKIEARDYATPLPASRFYQPGGTWHRVAVLGGIVLGR